LPTSQKIDRIEATSLDDRFERRLSWAAGIANDPPA
jgi:hypothetical protein